MSYTVLSVENGDRLVLAEPISSPYEKSVLKPIVLSFIKTPRLARRNASGSFGDDDPCAYDAAELVRSRFIGKAVKFTQDYYNEGAQRSAGRIVLQNGDDASVVLLKAGLALLPDTLPQGMDKHLFDRYTAAMAEARRGGKGLFSADAAKKVRTIKNMAHEDQIHLAESLAGKVVRVRVEKVLSSVGLIISATEFDNAQIGVRLTGVLDKDLDGTDLPELGKFHLERFLLNRNVDAQFDGLDKFNNIMISIVSKNGSFQEELLSKGFVKLHNATLPLSSHIEGLQKAEESAREKRLGTWRNYTPPEETSNKKVVAQPAVPTADGLPTTMPDGTPGPFYKGPLSFEGTLVQVVQADILVVEENATGKMIRLSLAGVRCPRGVTRDHEGNSSETRVTYDDYTWESREFVRTSYIGQNVAVQVEYARVIPESKEVRPAATITVTSDGANVGAALIEKGFAHFFLGKTDVCSCGALLQAAEETAKAANLALHSGHKTLPHKVVELSRLGEARAKYYLNFLQRGMQGGRPPVLSGVVDLVLGSSSLRVYIPKENFQIPVKVAGVITPQTAFNPHEKADPFSEEAKNFVVKLVQQREVNVQVYTSDRGGNFISAVTLKDGTNLSVALVEAGFATLGNADRLPFCQQLADAEEEARSAGLNIWSKESGGIPQRAAKLASERVASNPHKLARVLDDTAEFAPYTLTEVGEDGLSVYLQNNSEATAKAMQQVQPLLEKTVASGEYHPKKDELVVALYEADSMWCRGKVTKLNKSDNTAEVHYVDFGNTEAVPFAKIRAIPPNAHYDIVRDTAPAVILAKLAFVKVFAGDASVADAAAECIYDYAQGEVLAKAVYKDASNTPYYTVTKNVNVSSLSETLLQRGFALLDKRTSTVDMKEYKRHEAAKEIARKGHKGIWQYGDVDDGDEEDGN